MNVIVAGQRIVTQAEFVEAALGYDLDPVEPVGFDSAAGQDALRDLLADLEQRVENDVDVEDATHYRRLLGACVVRLPRRTAPRFTREVAA
jgi:hypothetical protein